MFAAMRPWVLVIAGLALGCGKGSDRSGAGAGAGAAGSGATTGTEIGTAGSAEPAGDTRPTDATEAGTPAPSDASGAATGRPAQPAPPGAFVIVTARAKAGKLLVTAAPDSAKLGELAGSRMAMFDDRGRVCAATIGAVIDAASCPGRTPAAELMELDGACEKAIYGIAEDATLATTRVGKAADPVDRAATEMFGADDQRMHDEKAALEGIPHADVANHVSTRVLERAGLDPIVLAYGTIHGIRTIALFAISTTSGTPDKPSLIELGEVTAPSPSRVVGADIDGDGALDAVISHDQGVAYVPSRGHKVELTCTTGWR
jgi:hypothetical protein